MFQYFCWTFESNSIFFPPNFLNHLPLDSQVCSSPGLQTNGIFFKEKKEKIELFRCFGGGEQEHIFMLCGHLTDNLLYNTLWWHHYWLSNVTKSVNACVSQLQSYCRLWCSIQRTRAFLYFFCYNHVIWLFCIFPHRRFSLLTVFVKLTLWIYFCLLPLQLNATLISPQASPFVINADSMYVRHILKRLELLQFILLPIYKKRIWMTRSGVKYMLLICVVFRHHAVL